MAGLRRRAARSGSSGRSRCWASGQAAGAVARQPRVAEFGLNTYSVLMCHRASNSAPGPKGMQQIESQTAVGARFWTRLAVDERGTDSIPVVHSGRRDRIGSTTRNRRRGLVSAGRVQETKLQVGHGWEARGGSAAWQQGSSRGRARSIGPAWKIATSQGHKGATHGLRPGRVLRSCRPLAVHGPNDSDEPGRAGQHSRTAFYAQG